MKLCQNCGKLNEDVTAVCSQCGSLLSNEIEYNIDNRINQHQQVKTNGYAIASLVLGVISFPFMCCCGLVAIIPSVLAIVFGFIAKSKIQASMGLEKGDGLALAGIILGFIGILLTLLSVLVFPFFWRGFVQMFNEEYNEIYF
ncbi:DUF4190 domain-containing protein [Acetivibrio straminisolvens]|jgi:hypothetical protein|uniref:DUF4190 domain-containing protein n=1 Tax=Acetivibrio straminisolvens TaxID=253314 RepID=UPI002240A607|nr:DUF4190 domain-containing protein [Acetivibrio straminisolvens]